MSVLQCAISPITPFIACVFWLKNYSTDRLRWGCVTCFSSIFYRTVVLINLFPAFSLFGYPGLADPGLLTETTLDVQRLLTNHTKVHYAGVNGINLPETFNGLGVRNLIYILLKLLEFYKSFITKPTSPGIHIIFIEEPEVHLHPQMQEVFISKLNDLPNVFAKKFNNGIPWPVQFVVTTHSSHLANKATFESMRYFFSCSEAHGSNIHSTKIKDLKMGLGGPLKEESRVSTQIYDLDSLRFDVRRQGYFNRGYYRAAIVAENDRKDGRRAAKWS